MPENIYDDLVSNLERLIGGRPADYPGASRFVNDRLAKIREHAARTGEEPGDAAWDGIAQEIASTFQGVDPEHFREAYEQSRVQATRSGRIEQYRREDRGAGPTSREVFGAVPFIGAGVNALRNYGVGRAMERVQDGTASQDDYAYVGRMQADQQTMSGRSILGRIASGASQVPAFGVEMLATGGIARGASQATGQAIGRAAATGAGRVAPAVAEAVAANPLTRAAATGAGFAAQAAAMPGRVAESVTQRMLPNELGGQGETIGQAIPRGFLDTAIEVGSESASALLPRRVANFGQGFVPRPVRELFRQAQIHGVPGEYFEERIGELVRGATGIATKPDGSPDFGLIGAFLQGDMRRFLEDSAVEAGTFAIPGAAGAAANFRSWSQLRGMPATGGPRLLNVPELGPAATMAEEARHAEVSQRAEERNAREVQRWLAEAPVAELRRWAEWEPVTRYVPREAVLSFAEARDQVATLLQRQQQQNLDTSEREQINRQLDGLQNLARSYADDILRGLRDEARQSSQPRQGETAEPLVEERGRPASSIPEPAQPRVESPAPAIAPAPVPAPVEEPAPAVPIETPYQQLASVAQQQTPTAMPAEMMPEPVRGAMSYRGFDPVRGGVEDEEGLVPVRGESPRSQGRILPTGPIPAYESAPTSGKILPLPQTQAQTQVAPEVQQQPSPAQARTLPEVQPQAREARTQAEERERESPAAEQAEVAEEPSEGESARTMEERTARDMALARSGNRNALIENELKHFQRMGGAYKAANREEMRARAAMELVQAAEKYVEAAKKPGFKPISFRGYAYRIVRRGLLEESGGVVAPGRDMKLTIGSFRKAEQKLETGLGRAPSFEETITEVNAGRRRQGKKPLTDRQQTNLREAMAAERVSTGQTQDAGGDELAPMIERLPSREEMSRVEAQDAFRFVNSILARLKDKEAVAVAERFFGLQGTLPEVSINSLKKQLGSSWQKVRDKLQVAVDHLVANTTSDLVDIAIGVRVPVEVRDIIEWNLRQKLASKVVEEEKAPTARTQQQDAILDIVRKGKIQRGAALNNYAEAFAELQDLLTNDPAAMTLDRWADYLESRGLMTVPRDRDGVNYLVEVLALSGVRRGPEETQREPDKRTAQAGGPEPGQPELRPEPRVGPSGNQDPGPSASGRGNPQAGAVAESSREADRGQQETGSGSPQVQEPVAAQQSPPAAQVIEPTASSPVGEVPRSITAQVLGQDEAPATATPAPAAEPTPPATQEMPSPDVIALRVELERVNSEIAAVDRRISKTGEQDRIIANEIKESLLKKKENLERRIRRAIEQPKALPKANLEVLLYRLKKRQDADAKTLRRLSDEIDDLRRQQQTNPGDDQIEHQLAINVGALRDIRQRYDEREREIEQKTNAIAAASEPATQLSTPALTDTLKELVRLKQAVLASEPGGLTQAINAGVDAVQKAYDKFNKQQLFELYTAFTGYKAKGTSITKTEMLREMILRFSDLQHHFYAMPVYHDVLQRLGIDEIFNGVDPDDPFVTSVRSAFADLAYPILEFLQTRGYKVAYYWGDVDAALDAMFAGAGDGVTGKRLRARVNRMDNAELVMTSAERAASAEAFHSRPPGAGSYVIAVNKDRIKDNLFATIAHEIGHGVHEAMIDGGFGDLIERMVGDKEQATARVIQTLRDKGLKMSDKYQNYIFQTPEIVAETFAEIMVQKRAGAAPARRIVGFVRLFPALADLLRRQIPLIKNISPSGSGWDIPQDLAAKATGVAGGAGRFDVPVSQAVPTSPADAVSEYRIIETMIRLFDQTWYHPDHDTSTYGLYKWRPETIMIGQMHAGRIGIATHETAHGIDKTYYVVDRMPQNVRAAIASLNYDPSIKDPIQAAREGFAELVRVKLTGDGRLVIPPVVDAWWANWRAANPKISAKLTTIADLVTKYRQQGPVARTVGRVVNEPKYPQPILSPAERAQDIFLNAWDAFQTKFIDRFHSLSKFDALVAKRRGHKDDLGLYEIAIAAQGTAPTLAAEAITRGVLTFRKNPNGKWETVRISEPITDVFKSLRDGGYDENEFMAYAISRQVLDDSTRPDVDVPQHEIDDANGVIVEIAKDQKKLALFDQVLKRWSDFSSAILQIAVDTGKITQQTADDFRINRPLYIPTFRVGHEISSGTGEASSGMNPMMKRTGSGLPRYNPVQATLEVLQMAYQSAHEQILMDTLWTAARDTEGVGRFVVEEPMHMAPPFEVHTDRVKKALIAIGYSQQLLNGPDDTLQFFMPSFFYDGTHPVMTIMIDGKPKNIRFVGNDGAKLYRTLARINDLELLHPVVKIFSLMTGAVRAGATMFNPAFALVRNPIRDVQHYVMTSKNVKGLEQFTRLGQWFARNLVSTMAELAGKDQNKIIELFDALGGKMQQHFGVDPGSIHQTRRRLMGTRTKADKTKGVFGEIYEAMSSLLAIPEGAPRLAEFHRVLRDNGVTDQDVGDYFAGKKALPLTALYRAINAGADVTVNFKKRGTLGRQLNAIFPYLNARIQGIDKWIRNIKDDPRRAMLAYSVMVAIYLAYLEGTPPEEEELDETRRDLNWNFFDENGRLVRSVPMAPEWAAALMPIGALWRYLRRNRPQAIPGLLWRMGMEFQPFGLPAGTPILEAMVNRNFRTWREIVPRYIEGERVPADQVAPSTLPFYDWLGKKIGVSPAKLQHIASGLTGGLATGGGFSPTRMSLGVFDEQVRMIPELTQAADWARQELGSEKKANRPLTDKRRAEAAMTVALDDLTKDLRRPGYEAKSRDERWATDRWAIGLAMFAQGLPETPAYPNPLRHAASPDMPPKIREYVVAFLRRQAAATTRPMPLRAPSNSSIDSVQQNWRVARAGSTAIFQALGLNDQQSIQAFVQRASATPPPRPSVPARQ